MLPTTAYEDTFTLGSQDLFTKASHNTHEYGVYDDSFDESLPLFADPMQYTDQDPSLPRDGTAYNNFLIEESTDCSNLLTANHSSSATPSFEGDTSHQSQAATPHSSRSEETSTRVQKRRANTLAARRSRQARVQKVVDLEAALKATQQERDALKLEVARLQGEAKALKELHQS